MPVTEELLVHSLSGAHASKVSTVQEALQIRGQIDQISYDNLTTMPNLLSTYDKTSYGTKFVALTTFRLRMVSPHSKLIRGFRCVFVKCDFVGKSLFHE